MRTSAYIVVNFGGPRSLKEIEPFLSALLCDRDVIRSRLPTYFHNRLFKRIARKRALKITPEYEKMGGGSPIWADTEFIKNELKHRLNAEVLSFHRYLPATHQEFINSVKALTCDEIVVFPLFAQFSYATTGSIARFFECHVPKEIVQKMRWVKSYPTHPSYIQASQNCIQDFLTEKNLSPEECLFLFSAHGLPEKFIKEGDLYAYECQRSLNAILKTFPKAESLLCYQSRFGPEEWLKPYTVDISQNILSYTQRKHCVFIPISFTSDHVETLVEVESQYLPLITANGLSAYRVPALNRRSDWLAAIADILQDSPPSTNSMLIRR